MVDINNHVTVLFFDRILHCTLQVQQVCCASKLHLKIILQDVSIVRKSVLHVPTAAMFVWNCVQGRGHVTVLSTQKTRTIGWLFEVRQLS